jgi:hypothetical protein
MAGETENNQKSVACRFLEKIVPEKSALKLAILIHNTLNFGMIFMGFSSTIACVFSVTNPEIVVPYAEPAPVAVSTLTMSLIADILSRSHDKMAAAATAALQTLLERRKEPDPGGPPL